MALNVIPLEYPRMKFKISLLISLIGALVLEGLIQSMGDLLSNGWTLPSAFIGAFVSTYFFVDLEGNSFSKNIPQSVKIVFSTFLAISIGHALHQLIVRQVSIDFEPVGKFLWASIITSWWLVPAVSLILTLLLRTFSNSKETKAV